VAECRARVGWQLGLKLKRYTGPNYSGPLSHSKKSEFYSNNNREPFKDLGVSVYMCDQFCISESLYK
jgi:hypothetical protein